MDVKHHVYLRPGEPRVGWGCWEAMRKICRSESVYSAIFYDLSHQWPEWSLQCINPDPEYIHSLITQKRWLVSSWSLCPVSRGKRTKCSICRVCVVVVLVFMQHKYCLASNLISPGRCHAGSLFVNEEQEGLARDIIHMAATETVMPDALMTSQTWSK